MRFKQSCLQSSLCAIFSLSESISLLIPFQRVILRALQNGCMHGSPPAPACTSGLVNECYAPIAVLAFHALLAACTWQHPRACSDGQAHLHPSVLLHTTLHCHTAASSADGKARSPDRHRQRWLWQPQSSPGAVAHPPPLIACCLLASALPAKRPVR